MPYIKDIVGSIVNHDGGIVDSIVNYPAVSVELDSDAQAIINEITTTPSAAYQTAINNFVVGAKNAASGNLWTGNIGAFWCAALNTEQAFQINWKDPTGTKLTKSGTGWIHTPGTGIEGVLGSNEYWDTGIAMNAMPLFSQNDAHLAAWVASTADSGYIMGVNNASNANASRALWTNATTTWGCRMNASSGFSDSGNVGNQLTVLQRTGASAVELFRNTTSLTTNSSSSVALSSNNLYLSSLNNNGTATGTFNGTIACHSAGASFSTAELSDFQTLVSNLVTELASA